VRKGVVAALVFSAGSGHLFNYLVRMRGTLTITEPEGRVLCSVNLCRIGRRSGRHALGHGRDGQVFHVKRST